MSPPGHILGRPDCLRMAELYVSAEASSLGAPPLPAHRPCQGLGPQGDWERGTCFWG